MAKLADSLVSSSSRPLSLRMRPDLTARQQRYHGQTYWVVKEPVGLNYFRFHEEEYAILCMMDGHASLDSIKERFEDEFTPQKITFGDLQQFIGMLHRSGLVLSSSPAQGKQLKKRRDTKKRKELLGKFTNVFAIRFRGIDPEWLLNKLYPFTRWFFRWFTVILVLLFGLVALSLVIVQFDVFVARLPAFHEFFGARNWFALGLTLMLVKVLHEFGHGLSCKHFGGECHEMGAMLLVFTPALYCNVSDSWMLRNKWHRVAIGAAGMYVELTLASIATFIWWFTDPSTLMNQLSLRVMFICSVSTILFNGNPLLRFDGYYILMDIAEIPNLRQKATEVLKRFLSQLCLGIEQPENPFLPQRRRFFFGLYTVAAVMYRWVVVFSILMFLNKVLEPYGLQIIGRLIAAVGFFGLVVQPVIKLGKFFYTPGRMHQVKRHRLAITAAVIVGLIMFVAMVPLPYHVDASFSVEAHDADTLFAAVPCILRDVLVEPGQRVKKGDKIAILESIPLRLSIEKLLQEKVRNEARRDALERMRRFDRRVAGQIRELNMVIAGLDEQHDKRVVELKGLIVRAPEDGVVMLAPFKKDSQQDGMLPTWSGFLLDRKNIGATLQPDDQICLVGDPKDLEAVLVIDQGYIDLVQHKSDGDDGDEVDLMLDANPGTDYKGKIESISEPNLQFSPINLSSQAGGQLGTVSDRSGGLKPISTSYTARVGLTDYYTDDILQKGLRGRAKIYTGWQSIGSRLYRYVARTFNFEL